MSASPSLPQDDYNAFAQQAAELLRHDRCEHVWGEVINVRGKSFIQTIAALDATGLIKERDRLAMVCGDGDGAEVSPETPFGLVLDWFIDSPKVLIFLWIFKPNCLSRTV